MSRSLRARALAVLLLATGLVTASTATAQVATRPFSVTITHVACVDSCDAEGLEAALEGHADFYAKVFINGVEQPRTPRIDNNSSIDPEWVIPIQLPVTIVNVPVTIQIWDYDSTSGDDLGDVSPHDDDNNLDFTVSYFDGKWRDIAATPTDNVNWPHSCSTGDGADDDEPRVQVCWDVKTLSTKGDSDGDGLLDGWELNGYNGDGDATIDVNLPAMDAAPRHKDLFVELDTVAGRAPTHAGVAAMKAAFAAAPLTAGSRAAGTPRTAVRA
ncbi:MAG: C2 domain-containing protein [Acidimicrobiales bacterium]